MIDIVECEEFGAIQLGVDQLMVDGEMALDPRIVDRGYLNIPKFETGANVEKIYFVSLIGRIERILDAGMMKSYVRVLDPPAWRGRLGVSDTIKRHRDRNVRYKHEFDFKTLSYSGPENVALKHSAQIVRAWLLANDKRNAAMAPADRILQRMSGISNRVGDPGALVREIGRSASMLPSHYSYYQNPLWTAYLLLQSKLPNLSGDGFLTLDSLIVDLSMVFEAFIRAVLSDRVEQKGWRVVDGNVQPYPFFTDNTQYRVQSL